MERKKNLNKIEDCSCPQPCDQTVYEASLSYALLSELSVDQIQYREGYDLPQKYEKALETVQRVDSKIFTNDISMLLALKRAYKEMERHVTAFLSQQETDSAIAIKILGTVAEIRLITVRDCRKVLEEMRKFKKTFETKFNNTISLLNLYHKNLNTSYSQVRQILELSGGSVTGYLEQMANDARMWADLARATVNALDNDMVRANLSTQNEKYLPDQYFEDSTKESCRKAFENLLRSLDTLINVYAGIAERAKTGSTRSDEIERLNKDMNVYNNLYGETDKCIHEYWWILDKIVSWLDEHKVENINDTNNEDLNKQNKTIAQFADNQEKLKTDRELVETNLLQYSLNQIEKLTYLEAITETPENEETTLQSKIDVFTNRVESKTVQPLKEMITNARTQLETEYKEALNFAVDIDNYMKKNYFYQGVTGMNIWKLPSPNVDEPSNPTYFRETLELWKIWDQNMPLKEFVRVSINFNKLKYSFIMNFCILLVFLIGKNLNRST